MSSKKMTGGEAVVETLIANDVKLVTGLIGSSTLEILDGLYNNADTVRYIGCRHESNGMSRNFRALKEHPANRRAPPSERQAGARRAPPRRMTRASARASSPGRCACLADGLATRAAHGSVGATKHVCGRV